MKPVGTAHCGNIERHKPHLWWVGLSSDRPPVWRCRGQQWDQVPPVLLEQQGRDAEAEQ